MPLFIKTVRLFFEKSGRAVYISHLDLVRAMSRALVRAGLPAWYTQGFHPHLYVTFALPLSLGVAGLRETMDFRLTEDCPDDAIVARLNAALPEGLRALSAAEPVMEPAKIMWADYELALRCDPGSGKRALEEFLSTPEIFAQKRGKKGVKTVDIKPLFSLLEVSQNPRGLQIALRCRAGVEVSLNPALVFDTLTASTGLLAECGKIVRRAVLTERLELFC